MRQSRSHKLVNQVSETVNSRQLFDASDKLLIGISGGKDSLVLLDCLLSAGYKNLFSIHLRLDKSAPLDFADFCCSRSDFAVLDTDILTEVMKQRRKNHCYICSRARRKALCLYAVD